MTGAAVSGGLFVPTCMCACASQSKKTSEEQKRQTNTNKTISTTTCRSPFGKKHMETKNRHGRSQPPIDLDRWLDFDLDIGVCFDVA